MPNGAKYDIAGPSEMGYAALTRMTLTADKLRSLGWELQVGLGEAYRRLIGWLRELEGGSHE